MTRVRTVAGLAALVAGATLVAGPVVHAQTAVVSFAGSGADLRGVRVLARHPHLRQATVTGTPAALGALARRPGVRGVAPDVALRPTGKDNGSGDGVFAWDKLGGQAGRAGAGAGVSVALVDTGVTDSAALSRASGRLVDATDTSGTGTYADGYGHGTFMAGLIAGGPVQGTESRGLGVAPAARILNVKVADAAGESSLSKVVAGLEWVAANAASVDLVSFSFSRTRPGDGYGADPLTDAVERVRAAGVLPVVSAGNVAGEVGDPGFDPRVLTVGAADLTAGRVAVTSWSGSATVAGVAKPDLVASGVGVLSMLPADSTIATSFPSARRGELWRGSGTSEATAIAAGVAAMFLAEFPAATTTEVKASMRSAASDLPGSADGAGLVDVPKRLVDGTEAGSDSYGGDGEGGFDAGSWGAGSWGAGSWGAGSWGAGSWGAGSWGSSSWG